MNFSLSLPTVAVFSHPNHEIAVLATLKKLRPRLIFLTDGGGEHRINETRKGLASIGLLDHAIFLPHTEQSFYDALLDLDSAFFEKVSAEVRAIFRSWVPEQILCDAVEFYNPVHDMTLPIVGAADDGPWGGIFEVPLLYQKPGPKESYGVQTAPEADRIELKLSNDESDLKASALKNIYTILRDTLGSLILSSPSALKTETLLPAKTPLRSPDPERVLRYERRAAALMQKGDIRSEITHTFHFLPIVSDLLGDRKK